MQECRAGDPPCFNFWLVGMGGLLDLEGRSDTSVAGEEKEVRSSPMSGEERPRPWGGSAGQERGIYADSICESPRPLRVPERSCLS